MTPSTLASHGGERPRTLPRAAKVVPTERQVQRAILQMMGYAFRDVFVFHVPNGAHLAGDDRDRRRQMGGLLGDGLKPGMTDLVCVWNRGVAFLEVKRPGCAKRLSPEQVKIHDRLAELGFEPAVVTSPAEAFHQLKARGAPSSVQEWREG